jgi:hypothetical protein
MTHSTCAFVGWLTLCTLVPAFSQTSAPEGIEPELSLSGPKPGAADVRGSVPGFCSALPKQFTPCPTAREQAQLAERFVNERLAVWRQYLHLEDWKISIVMTRRSDLKPKTRGHVRWDKDKKSAVIGVLDPSDYQLPFREMLDDMEFTIVHELVHLELASLPRSEASRSSEEHAVNGITEALLRLDRQR